MHLDDALGQMKIKGVEDVGTPVDEHSAACLELRQLESVTGVEPGFETAGSSRTVGSIHEMVERFLECICLQEPVGEAEHDVHGGAILIGKSDPVFEQQPPGTFEVAALIGRQLLLHASTDVVHGLRAKANHMEAVNDDLCVGQEGSGHIAKAAVHVHDDVLYLVPVGKGVQVILNRCHGSVRQNVEYAAVQRVGNDALKTLAVGIPLELVEGNGLRQPLRSGDGHHPQHPLHAADGGLRISGYVLHAAAPAQQFHDFFAGAVGEAHIPAHEFVLLRKPLSALRTNVSPSPVLQPQRFPTQLQIPHLPDAVIMNPICFSAAPLAGLHSSLQ